MKETLDAKVQDKELNEKFNKIMEAFAEGPEIKQIETPYDVIDINPNTVELFSSRLNGGTIGKFDDIHDIFTDKVIEAIKYTQECNYEGSKNLKGTAVVVGIDVPIE